MHLPALLTRFLIFVLPVAAALLTSCGGGGTTYQPAPTLRPSSVTGVLSGATPSLSGVLSSPQPLPTPASGAYTLAGLASSLDAAQTPAPNASVGTVGVVTANTGTTLTVSQIPLVSTTDSSGNAIPFEQNIPRIGSFSAPLTIAIGASTVFANANGPAGLPVGTMIVATGSGDANAVLHASSVAPLGYSSPAPTAVARTAANAAPSGRRSAAAFDTNVSGAFNRKIVAFVPALKYSTPVVNYNVPVLCSDAKGNPLPNAAFIFQITPQAVLSLGELDVNLPFNVSYQKNPDNFLITNGAVTGPPPAGDWLNFIPTASPGNGTYSAELTAGVDLGLVVSVQNTCVQGSPVVQVATATLGYAIQSQTSDPLPGPIQSTTFKSVSCIGINEPLNFNFFNPISGFGNLNPFGTSGAANLSFCDLPTLSGNYVTGNVNNVVGGSINTSPVAFDPSQTGPSNVYTFGQITATATPLSFNLTNLQYQPFYKDGYQFQYTLLGVTVLATPSVSVFTATFAPLTTADVPVSINATPNNGECVAVSGTTVFTSSACAPGSVSIVLCNKPNPTPNSMCQSGVTSSATAVITDPGYSGAFVLDPANSNCSTVQTTDPITLTPASGSGPTATFTINAGPQQVADGQGNDCTLTFETQPASGLPQEVGVHIIMPT